MTKKTTSVTWIMCTFGIKYTRVFCIFLLFITYNALKTKCHTVNLEVFASVLISRSFAYAKFRENKNLAKGDITLSFIEVGKSCLSREFLTSQICLLTLFVQIKFSRKFPDL